MDEIHRAGNGNSFSGCHQTEPDQLIQYKELNRTIITSQNFQNDKAMHDLKTTPTPRLTLRNQSSCRANILRFSRQAELVLSAVQIEYLAVLFANLHWLKC